MPHCWGYRARCRYKISKPFGKAGNINISKTLTSFRIGDYVDVVIDAATHKGMPHNSYHGKTGQVFNVNPRAVGVVVTKRVGNRIIRKRIHVRTEHVKFSNCREAFKARVRENDKKKQQAKKDGKKISTKRLPVLPREEHVVKAENVKFQHPLKFTEVF